MALSDLPNIGEHNERILEQVGIDTPAKLIEAGAENAWLAMKAVDPGICLHALYGLEGAIRGIPKKDLPPERKSELKRFFDAEK